MRIGIVTCQEIPDLIEKEKPLIPLFSSKGIVAEPLVWDDPSINWAEYNFLIIRSIWDYHKRSEEFLSWLDMLDLKKVRTLNSSEVIRSNRHKFYLKELQSKGVNIIPTIFIDKTDDLDLQSVMDLSWDKSVIKPAVSASAFMTESFLSEHLLEVESKYKNVAQTRDLLIQKFVPEVQTFGELSIIFFNRKYSHTVLKTPKKNEFRVQEEYGGLSILYDPGDNIIEAAMGILNWYIGDILYARVDGVVVNNQFSLMEIELIEPDLFLDHHPEARSRFVESAIDLIQF